LDGKAPAGKERSESLNHLLEQLAARADETLNLPLGRLLEKDTA
jgi:hypothetical protein